MNHENDLLVESLLEELESQTAAAQSAARGSGAADAGPVISWKDSETGEALLARAKIPEKSFFRIGEVAKIVGVKPYVLRYWESEFTLLKPQKSQSQQRVYRRTDVENVLLVKHLLYAERYSIEGARRRIKELKREGELAAMRGQLALSEAEAEAQAHAASAEAELAALTGSATDVLAATREEPAGMNPETRERIQNLAREVLLLVHSFDEQVLS